MNALQITDQPGALAGIESASSAVAAQARAMVESRYVMAMRNPRNWDQVRLDLVKECRRPSFADNKSAYYVKPIGAGVEGLGIRFVEVALRCMKNVLVETSMIFEDELKEVHRVSVTDLEANITYPLDVRVSKTVERSKPNADGSFISVRKNSNGRDTYTLVGTDDDILNKRGALISKAIRTLGLRIIPGDLCDEAETIIKQVRLDKAAQDPDAERRKIVDAFSEIGVSATDLTQYLGHQLGQCSPAQIVKLRGIWGAIRDGESTWQQVMQNEADQSGAGVATAKPKVVMPTARSAGPTVNPDTGEITQPASAQTSQPSTPPAPPPAPRESVPGMATDGERKLIINRARNANIDMAQLTEQAGVSGLPADLAGLTKDGFIALRDCLPKAA